MSNVALTFIIKYDMVRQALLFRLIILITLTSNFEFLISNFELRHKALQLLYIL